MIYPITPGMLREDILLGQLYPDLDQTLYWSARWDPTFYVDLARAGFISISHAHPDHGSVQIAELQASYAVLDWDDLHRSGHVRRLIRSGRLEEEEIELQVSNSCERVIERLIDYHRPATWLSPPYRALLSELPRGNEVRFGLRAIELWSRKHDYLVAGELGYTIGKTYTSLSGFTTRPDRRWRNFGTLQLVMLAERLRDHGFDFWNMGHTQQAYKLALGARVIPRDEFLRRWQVARSGVPDDLPTSFYAGAEV